MPNGPTQQLKINPARFLRRALRAHENGELAKAERLYNALLQYHPENFDALHGLGQLHYQRGRLDTALVLIQTALKSDIEPRRGIRQSRTGFSCAASIQGGAFKLR